MHWCHGAPGAIHLMISALILFNEEKYLQSAKRCADLIWHRGLLKKGPGICHGVSGNGYALLLLSRVVNDPVLLEKAKAFAVVMMDPNFEVSKNNKCLVTLCFSHSPSFPTHRSRCSRAGQAPSATSSTCVTLSVLNSRWSRPNCRPDDVIIAFEWKRLIKEKEDNKVRLAFII